MEVRKWMKHPVHCVKPLDSIHRARQLMEMHRINQLPVVVDNCLVGIVTDRDVRAAFPSVFDAPPFRRPERGKGATEPGGVTVEMVMTTNVMTVQVYDSMVSAAREMRRERIGALPVLDGERIVGIITRSDILDFVIDGARHDANRETRGRGANVGM